MHILTRETLKDFWSEQFKIEEIVPGYWYWLVLNESQYDDNDKTHKEDNLLQMDNCYNNGDSFMYDSFKYYQKNLRKSWRHDSLVLDA